ncbi:GTP-binding protein [uncultured Draconibacterium sp.]|uniref:CobW family GTP-binding protein n=1 Tax=uncultured Draconibacterium sp. TaxID=1573823 RepID=UPI00321689D9
MKRTSKIPVTVITGFLGAGKTTFINYLLQSESATQFALVENEFGEVAIDTKLIKGVDTSQMFELKQGCICCTITDEYELVLKELAERFPEVDHLLIETTGIADPAAVIQPFFSDEELNEIYEYNGTVCLVDVLNFWTHPEQETHLKQLVIADMILLSKAENLLPAEINKIQNELQSLNPFATSLVSEYGAAAYNLQNIQRKTRTKFDFVGHRVSHTHIQTKTFSFSNPVNKEDFINRISYTLDVYKNQIYRCKGILFFEDEPFQYILQGVGGSFEITEGDLIVETFKSEVVFIGKLDSVQLDF